MKDASKMDATRLIAEIYKRPALWNQRHVLYHNREVTNRIWTELATIMKLSKVVLKAKWKGLRDTYRSELKKEQIYRKTKSLRHRPTWTHFKSLYFLKEQMLPRPPIWERANGQFEHQIPSNCSSNSDSSEIKTEESSDIESSSSQNNNTEQNSIINDKSLKIIFKHAKPQHQQSKNNTKEDNKAIQKNTTTETATILKTKLAVFSTAIAGNTTSIPCEIRLNEVSTPKILEKSLVNIDSNILSSNNQNVINNLPIKDEPLDQDCNGDSMDIGNSSDHNIHINVNNDEQQEEEMLQNVSPEQVLFSSETSRETVYSETSFDPLDANKLDDNYYFFMSLLPHIKDLSGHERMLLRMQVQDLVYKLVYKKNEK